MSEQLEEPLEAGGGLESVESAETVVVDLATQEAEERPAASASESATEPVAFVSASWDANALPAPFAEAKPKRNIPWRWVGAFVTAAAVGTGCAFAVMAPQRADLPGLKTPSDGRYVFAPLSLPTLSPGQLPPDDISNASGQHLADIRKLLLPSPQGAVSDHALPLSDGWLPETESLSLTWSPSAQLDFGHYGWRHTAAESWKTSDGAETKIYLLQFSSESNASSAESTLDDMTGVPDGAKTPTFTFGADQILTYYKASHGSTNTWYGITQVQDTVLEIVYTAPSSVGMAPFRQEFSLQTQLLN